MTRRGNNEGSIYKRADGRWTAAVHLGYEGGRRRRKAIYGKTRQEVARKLAAALRAREQGLPQPAERQTVGSLLQTWLRDSAAQRVRPRTLQRYSEIVRLHLIPALGSVRLAKLAPDDVERAMNAAVSQGASPRSVAQHRAVLRRALNVAMRWSWISRNVASLCEPPRAERREVHALTPADARRLLEAVRGDRLEALFAVALASGMRQGEALGLRWDDVDLGNGTISVQRTLQRIEREWRFLEPKTSQSRRTLPLAGPVASALREHRARQLEERLRAGGSWDGPRWGELVFADEFGCPLSGFHVLRRLRELLSRAGLQPMRYHDLRHGAASLMAA